MTTPASVVIIGASVSGVTVATTLREEGFAGRITLIGRESHLPYNRPPLSKQVLSGEWEPDRALIHRREQLEDLGIDVVTECEATALDSRARIVHTTSGAFTYDDLVIATGVQAREHPDFSHALCLRTLDDAVRLREAFRQARRVAVLGAGILGSEIASAARSYGAEALIVGRSGALSFGGVGSHLSRALSQLHREHGVELALRAEIVAVHEAQTSDHQVTTTVSFGDGTVRTFDLVVSAIGGSPQTRWLEGSGITIENGVQCTSEGVAAPGVSAVGDVAAWLDPVSGKHSRTEHQSHAIEQAVQVACRIVHAESGPFPVPSFWSEVHGVRINAHGWFDPKHPLDDAFAHALDRGAVWAGRDASGRVHGVVGWNATPRDFRAARTLVTDALLASVV